MKEFKGNTMQALWVVLGSLSSFSLAIVSSVVLSRYFDKAEYGTYKQILYVYNLLLVIFCAGLPKAFSYFLPKYSMAQGKAIVARITWILFLAGLLFSGFLYFNSDVIAHFLGNEELSVGLKLFSPVPMLLLPTLGIEGIFSAYRRTINIAIYNTISRMLMLVIIVGPVILFNGDYKIAILGWLFASLLNLFMALYFKSLPFRHIESDKVGLSYKELLSYSIPLVGASIAGIAIGAADHFFISRYFGADEFAEYSNGFQQVPIIGMITSAASLVLMPLFSRMQQNKASTAEFLEVFRNTLFKSALIIYPILIFCLFYAEEIILILYTDLYAGSVKYFKLSMLGSFFNIVIFAPLILGLGHVRFYSYFHIIVAVIIWIGEYLIVLKYNSAVTVIGFSVLITIVKIIIAFLYSMKLIDASIKNGLPWFGIFKIIVHSLLAMIFLKYIIKAYVEIEADLIKVIFTFILYMMLLLMTSRLFRIQYLSPYRPILNALMGSRFGKSL